jgi:hypothetical protein
VYHLLQHLNSEFNSQECLFVSYVSENKRLLFCLTYINRLVYIMSFEVCYLTMLSLSRLQAYTFHDKFITSSSWNRALLEKPPIGLPLQNFPAFYGIQKFISAFTRAHHWSYPEPDQSSPYHPVLSGSIFILSTHLRRLEL